MYAGVCLINGPKEKVIKKRVCKTKTKREREKVKVTVMHRKEMHFRH